MSLNFVFRLSCPLFAALALSAALSCPAVAAYSDPAARWNLAGLRTAPPTPVQTVSVRDYGAKGDGTTDDTAAFQSALSAVAKPGVVSIPAGTYRITQTLELTTGVVLRGVDAKTSKLVFNMGGTADPCIDFTTYNSKSWVNLTKDGVLGQNAITVSSASSMAVGNWVEIEQQNDAAKMYTDPEWNQDWAQNVVGQFAIITAISGTTVTLDRPLRIDYTTSLAAHVRVYRMGHDVGIEDLNLSREDTSPDGGDIIHFKYAANCWVRRVESTYTVGSHVYAESSAAIEVSDSTFKYSHEYGDGGRGYGVSLGRHVSDCLVQNNIFETLRHAMIVSQGANGNVYGYNYSSITVCESTEWTPCDISVHGHYPFRNLFEGNVVQEIDITDYWGPAGPANVLLRNVVQREGIEVMDASNGQVILGNEVQNGGPLTVASGITGTVMASNILLPGTPTAGSGACVTDVPQSLYLASPPSFYANCSWPMLVDGDPLNPAGMRYLNILPATPTPTPAPASKASIQLIINTLLLS